MSESLRPEAKFCTPWLAVCTRLDCALFADWLVGLANAHWLL